jgi:hypothetical protein
MKRRSILIWLALLVSLLHPAAASPSPVKKHPVTRGRGELSASEGLHSERASSTAGFYTHDLGVIAVESPQGYITAGTYAPVAAVCNFGTVKERAFNVLLTISGGYASSKAIDSLAPDESLAVTFDNWTVSQVGAYEFRCSTAVPNDSDPSNDCGYGLAAIPDWIQDFESDNGGFRADPPSQTWAWGVPAPPRPGAHSGTKLWAAPLADTYPDFADWRLFSPAYIATSDTPVIGFWHWYNTEETYDGGNLKYSTDAGQTWNPDDLYPWTPYALPYDDYIEGLRNEDGYTGLAQAWRLAWFRIPVGPGQAFHLLWDFGSDITITSSGWMVDDVAGAGCRGLSQDVGAIRITAPPGIISPGAYTPKAWVRNFGTEAASSFEVHLVISGGYQNVRTVSSLAPGESVEVTFGSWSVSDTGLHFLTCSTALSGDQDPASDARYGLTAIPHGFTDFEPDNGELAPDTGPNGWTWGIPGPGRNAHSGSRTWGAPLADTYPSNAKWRLCTPLLVSLQDDPAVSFWHWYDFEHGFDWGKLYYARQVNYWNMLEPWQPYSRPYDDDVGFSRRDTLWRQAWFEIPVAAGTPLRLSWYMGSDFANNFQGWLVDDFARIGLRLAQGRDVGVRTIWNPQDTVVIGSLQPSAEVINLGYDMQSFRVTMRILDSAGGQCYLDTVRVDTLASGSPRYVSFLTWAGPPRVGRYTAICYTSLAGDSAPDNDTLRRQFVAVPQAPVLTQPPNWSTVYTGYPLFRWDSVPRTTRYDIQVSRYDWPHYDTLVNESLLTQTSYPADTFLPPNDYRWQVRAWVGNYGSRWAGYHYVTTRPPVDVGVTAIVSPSGVADTNAVIAPLARARNYGPHPADFPISFRIDSAGRRVYADTVQVSGLGPGAERVVTFDVWPKPHRVGNYTTCCSTLLAGDTNPGNNQCTGSFEITLPVVETGWARKADMPPGPKGRNVTLGGALAYMPLQIADCRSQIAESPDDGSRTTNDGGSVYAFKGSGRCEFYQYKVSDNAWITKESIPAIGRAGKKRTVKKGATLGAAEGKLYATKGNNTLEFWRYDPSSRARLSYPSYPWSQLADIPAGDKNVREGAGVAPVVIGDTAWIYFLKGSSTEEFYRYNTVSNTWYMLPDAPDGESGKPYRSGSGVAYDPDRNVIYALKNSVNEFYRYFIDSNFWRVRASLPLVGASGRKKRVGSGAGIAYCSGNVYALKGLNTLEFWRYSPDSDRWTQSTDMPVGGGKKVRGGGALTAAEDALHALKGNNTLEFYRYGIPPTTNDGGRMTSVQTSSGVRTSTFALRTFPNPFTNAATVNYSLPEAGNVSLKLYDVTGKLVSTLATGYRPAGASSFAIRHSSFACGVYLLKLKTENQTVTSKLIIE